MFYYICDINITVMALLGHILGIIIVIYSIFVVVAMFRYARKFDPKESLFENRDYIRRQEKKQAGRRKKTDGD